MTEWIDKSDPHKPIGTKGCRRRWRDSEGVVHVCTYDTYGPTHSCACGAQVKDD